MFFCGNVMFDVVELYILVIQVSIRVFWYKYLADRLRRSKVTSERLVCLFVFQLVSVYCGLFTSGILPCGVLPGWFIYK